LLKSSLKTCKMWNRNLLMTVTLKIHALLYK